MATHLYPQEATPAISPTFQSGWESTSSAVRGTAASTPYAPANATTIIPSTGTTDQDVLHRQIICGPWAAQALSGTFRMVSRAREEAAGVNARAQLVLAAYDLDGVIIGSPLIDFDTASLSDEIGTSFGVIRFPRNYPDGGTTISATLSEPFYLGIEIGFRCHGTNTSSTRLGLNGSVGVDLLETEGDTTVSDAWFEFSQTLQPYVAAGVGSLTTGHLHIGKFLVATPLYTIENEVLSHDELDEGAGRTNVVVVDGQENSWTEYDRSDLTARDAAINVYLDLPELTNSGAVKQRAVEELQTARSVSSPGGEISGPLVLTTSLMDPIFWIDADGNKYQTRIEGKSVSFNQSTAPVQRATIDTGAIIFCPPEGDEGTYIARDLFDRDAQTELGDALIGGSWVIYT